MKKTVSKLVLALSFSAMAAGAQASTQDAAGCGVGTMIFKDKQGLVYNLLATTTNAWLFGTVSQTFGLLNCPKDTSITGKIASFIEFNKPQLAVEVAQGKGERLAALIEMYGVQADKQAAAIAALKANQVEIFSQPTSLGIHAEMAKTLQAYVS